MLKNEAAVIVNAELSNLNTSFTSKVIDTIHDKIFEPVIAATIDPLLRLLPDNWVLPSLGEKHPFYAPESASGNTFTLSKTDVQLASGLVAMAIGRAEIAHAYKNAEIPIKEMFLSMGKETEAEIYDFYYQRTLELLKTHNIAWNDDGSITFTPK